MTFTIVYTEDEDDPEILNVSVPALPGCHTYGRGKRQAFAHAKEAVELYLESLLAHGDPIPVESSIEQIEITV